MNAMTPFDAEWLEYDDDVRPSPKFRHGRFAGNEPTRSPDAATVEREPCGYCGAMCDPGEYHPYPFCVWVKAGLDPWKTLRTIAGQVGITDPGSAPPRVWEIHAPPTSQAMRSR